MQILIKRSLQLLPAGSLLTQTRDGWYAGRGRLLSPLTIRCLIADGYAATHEGPVPKERWYVGRSGQLTQDMLDVKGAREKGFECFLYKMDALVESERKKNPNTRYQSVRKRKKQPVTLLGTCPE